MKPESQLLIDQTVDFIKARFLHEGSGHDWEHIRRVWQTARQLALITPGADLLLTELGALLHDVADWKFHQGDEEAGPRAAREWLASLAAPEALIDGVETIIREISFKGAGVPTPMSTLAGQLVQDADRLDAIGAIGVARAFAYGGHKGRPLHNPAVPVVQHTSFASYQASQSPTLNHFYEKLLHLAGQMNTPAARQLAQQRHAFLEVFVAQFLREWEGADVASLLDTTSQPLTFTS